MKPADLELAIKSVVIGETRSAEPLVIPVTGVFSFQGPTSSKARALLCVGGFVAISGCSNVSEMRTVGTSLKRITRSWSMDCVLISSVFCKSWTLSRHLLAQYIRLNFDCFGLGYQELYRRASR